MVKVQLVQFGEVKLSSKGNELLFHFPAPSFSFKRTSLFASHILLAFSLTDCLFAFRNPDRAAGGDSLVYSVIN